MHDRRVDDRRFSMVRRAWQRSADGIDGGDGRIGGRSRGRSGRCSIRTAVIAAGLTVVCSGSPAWAVIQAGDLRLGATIGASVPYQHYARAPVFGGWMEYSVPHGWALAAEVRHSLFESSFHEYETSLSYVSLSIRAKGRSAASWHPYLALGAAGFLSRNSPPPDAPYLTTLGVSASVGFHHEIGRGFQWGLEAGYCGPTGIGEDQLLTVATRLSWLLSRST